MYAYLNGQLAEKSPDTVVIDCNGIGFELKIPLSTFEQLPELFEPVKLFVYTYQNEEGTRLFGFFRKQEKELFKLLININRIGPKLALAILSTISIKDLITAIISNNTNIIAKTPGLGKKSAERLIVELKDKIEEISELDAETYKNNVIDSDKSGLINGVWNEVETALLALGYKPFEVRKALQNVKFSDNVSTQEIVKNCIKYIYMKRNE
jgi:Holliday junction DNA helicase RuvA